MDYPVEIKANVEPSSIDAALYTFGLTDAGAEHKSIYFLETSSGSEPLFLYAQHVILRLRRGDDEADCTLKFRPCEVNSLPAAWKSSKEAKGWKFRIEEDWSGTYPKLSASLAAELAEAIVDPVVRGGDPTALFSADQLALFDAYTSHRLDTTRLRLLGPVTARKWKIKADDKIGGEEVGHDINCEEWVIGDTLRFLELSGREDDLAAARETRRQLNDLYTFLDVHISTAQELKTKIVLDYFANAAPTP